MNIFAVEENPKEAARSLCDKHVVKMILESAQIMATVARSRGFESPYRSTHAKHPCTLWAGRHPANWVWLAVHADALGQEYTERYGKIHKSHPIINDMYRQTTLIWEGSEYKQQPDFWTQHTPFEQCMPDQYKRRNPIDGYRAYYIGEKASIATWKLHKPSWFPEINNVK